MKIVHYVIVACFFFGITQAQVGIGTVTPNATLDIKATNQATPANNDGILIPKIDEFPTTAPTAAQDGMMVYVTGAGTPAKGFYFGTRQQVPGPFYPLAPQSINGRTTELILAQREAMEKM